MKREWHMNLKTVNTKHLKMDFKNYQNVAQSTNYARLIYRESIKYSFLKSYGKFKMCFTCATYTDLSLLITYEIPRVWLR